MRLLESGQLKYELGVYDLISFLDLPGESSGLVSGPSGVLSSAISSLR